LNDIQATNWLQQVWFTKLHITELNEAKLTKTAIGGILPKLTRSMQSSNEVTLQLVVLVEGQN